jgi:hypothetical protein
MRLLKRDQREVTFRPRQTLQEEDATTYEGWGDPQVIKGNIQPAGGRVMVEQYGDRLGYMLTMYVEGKPTIPANSGAWVFAAVDAEQPDYKVVAVRPWRHTVVELEKVMP